MIFIINVVELKLNNVIKPSADQSTWFFVATMKGGMSCGRKGSIRNLQPSRQLHRGISDRIHRDRDKLRYAGSAPRHSPDQQELLLSQAADCSAGHEAEAGADRGGAEWAVEDGVVILQKLVISV